jgi:hypothetical protein
VSTLHQPIDYNSNLTLIYLFIIEEFFFHTTIIVDNHFWKTAPFFITITLITSISKAGHPRIVNKKKVLNELFHEEKHMNEVIAGISLLFQSHFMKTKNNMIML